MDAVIFDCDGTLVDSEGLANGVLVELVAAYGLHLSRGEALAAFRGGQMAECVAELQTRLGRPLPDDFVSDLRGRMASTFRRRLRPVPGAVELVRSLSLPKCVASNGPREKIELSLSLTGLLPFFVDRIFSSYDVGTWKPDPGLFLHVAGALGVSPSRCAVVEDSLPGICAGVAAGMRVFAFQPHYVDERIPPGVSVVRSLEDLRSVL